MDYGTANHGQVKGQAINDIKCNIVTMRQHMMMKSLNEGGFVKSNGKIIEEHFSVRKLCWVLIDIGSFKLFLDIYPIG